ncbi:MAG TPA: hypothetical protein VF916_11195, partial [Ktedonobacterales bacterium]
AHLRRLSAAHASLPATIPHCVGSNKDAAPPRLSLWPPAACPSHLTCSRAPAHSRDAVSE